MWYDGKGAAGKKRACRGTGLWGLITILGELAEMIITDEVTVLFVSMLPVAELRGAIPLAMALGMPPGKALLLGVLGSIIPAFPILLYLTPISQYLRRTILRPLINWALKRGLRKSKGFTHYQSLGLFLFVAIPLPSTGVWTGSIIASLLGMSLRQALPPIALGTTVAGIIMVALSYHIRWLL
jgi:uncharacterized membrane protein